MQRVYYDDIVQRAQNAKGRIHKLYLHWTAGHYDMCFSDYHVNIMGDGAMYMDTEDFTTLHSHTWRRNTGSVGIAMCCASDAMMCADGSFTLGSEPPTQAQIETMALLVAVLAQEWNIPIDGEHIMTHAEAADLDGYGPQMRGTTAFEKWDLYKLPDYDGSWRPGGVVLRGKAAYYCARGC